MTDPPLANEPASRVRPEWRCRWKWIVAVALLCFLAAGTGALAASAPAPVSPVSVELFRYRCRSEIGLQDVTLFGNGTLRLLQGPREQRRMRLLELGPDDLEDLRARLLELALEETATFGGDLEGEWIGQCLLELGLPEREPSRFRFHVFDTLSLELQRAVDLGRELIELVTIRADYLGLPNGYEPKIGDFLRRADGELFEVVAYTGEGRGVELHGFEQPLAIYVAIADLRRVFVELLADPP